MWFAQLRKLKEIDRDSIPIILKVHLDLSKLFMEISGLEKRSLASKYLHFHFPKLFFIFDSRAKNGLSILLKNKVISRAKKSKHNADNEYIKLFSRCLELKNKIQTDFKLEFNPRQIDNLLLNIDAQTKKAPKMS